MEEDKGEDRQPMHETPLLYLWTQHHLFQHQQRFEDPLGSLQADLKADHKQEDRVTVQHTVHI